MFPFEEFPQNFYTFKEYNTSGFWYQYSILYIKVAKFVAISLSRHKWAMTYYVILCHSMSYVTTIMASL